MKFHYREDTIAALSTPFGEGGIAVIRISGENAIDIAAKLYASSGKKKLKHFRIHYGNVVNPFDKSFVDEALFLVMKAPYSYTRENVVEIQCHGGMIPVRKIMNILNSMGVRNALPGEFTKRAFLNGRIDLLQAEAVMDLINAKTDKSFEIATNQLSGKFSSELLEFKNLIIDLIAKIEAPLDYPEENLYDIDAGNIRASLENLLSISEKMQLLCEGGKIYRNGVKVSIIGKPNVGKSSILNMLLGEKRAIVTEYAGTTRDTIEESIVLDSIPISLCDTAGLHDTCDFIEKLGVEKTKESLESADFVIVVFDISSELTQDDKIIFDLVKEFNKDFIAVFNKSDLCAKCDPAEISLNMKYVMLSAVSFEGREKLEFMLSDSLKTVYRAASQGFFLASQRHNEALEQITCCIKQAVQTLDSGYPMDMLLVYLRDILSVIALLCGESFDEAVLDKIFSEFCIGK